LKLLAGWPVKKSPDRFPGVFSGSQEDIFRNGQRLDLNPQDAFRGRPVVRGRRCACITSGSRSEARKAIATAGVAGYQDRKRALELVSSLPARRPAKISLIDLTRGTFKHAGRYWRTAHSPRSVSPEPRTLAAETDTGPPMQNDDDPDHRSALKRLFSRPRIVMGLLLIIAIPIFIGLANKAVRENADAIQQGFGR
jgi:hypothetical protein